MTTLSISVLTKNQTRTYGPKFYTVHSEQFKITAKVRHDDQCGNGHNSFSITAEIHRKSGGRWTGDCGGCCHEEVAKHFPELAPFIKWHLTSSDGPMHYIANTVYHVQQGNLDYARSTAVWPNSEVRDLCEPGLTERLQIRLPALMVNFQMAVESLGFVY